MPKAKKSVKKSKTKKESTTSKSRVLTPTRERDVAMDIASKVHKKFDSMIKATVFFGSQAKKTAKPGSDTDIVIIVDDVSINWDLELISWYREELGKLLANSEHSRELHVITIKLSTWWNDLMHGEPVVLNIIRNGEVLIDIGGFFAPLKALLVQGRIHSTPEAVYVALQRAPAHLTRSKLAEMGAIEGIYWCMVDSAQAALMMAGILPPSPEHVTSMLKKTFVDSKLLPMEYVTWYRDVFVLHKAIMHREIRDVKGAEIDIWQERAERFLKKMTEIIDRMIESQKAR